MFYRFTKRTLDIAGGLLALLALSLPMALIAIAIKLDSRGPVFFRQERIGKGGKAFMIWKYRTMVVGAASKGLGAQVVKDDDRITRMGRTLRAFSLDELPQLFNVLTGDMSLIGPRPTLRYQVEAYTPHQRQRLNMRPGITSLASVKGRNNLSWADRIELDVDYVKRASLWLDFRIFVRTFWVAFITREGVYNDEGVNDDFVGKATEHRG
jgi:lipopolysaccharide/colanic/teichoic acid biosynthesis glycosyltransferase